MPEPAVEDEVTGRSVAAADVGDRAPLHRGVVRQATCRPPARPPRSARNSRSRSARRPPRRTACRSRRTRTAPPRRRHRRPPARLASAVAAWRPGARWPGRTPAGAARRAWPGPRSICFLPAVELRACAACRASVASSRAFWSSSRRWSAVKPEICCLPLPGQLVERAEPVQQRAGAAGTQQRVRGAQAAGLVRGGRELAHVGPALLDLLLQRADAASAIGPRRPGSS